MIEQLRTEIDTAETGRVLLRLISEYQQIIENRIDFFNTLFYFLAIGIAIQFAFMIFSFRRYIITSSRLENSEEVLKLLNTEREKERLHISSNLHDSILQDISSLLISENMANCPEAAGKLRGISDRLRNLTYRIAPVHLHTAGLTATIAELTEDLETETGASADFKSSGYEDELISDEVRLVFFRTAQEALNNIRKHAEAQNVTVNLVASHPFLILRIKDDGRGIENMSISGSGRQSEHLGMRLMNEQAKMIGAELSGESTPGAGTGISLKYRIK